jgi:hypothetical protein
VAGRRGHGLVDAVANFPLLTFLPPPTCPLTPTFFVSLHLQTLEYAMMPAKPGAASGGTLWIVQQMCNHGTLIEAGEQSCGGC